MKRGNRAISCAALAASILILVSCLSRETLHDLYLDPDGSVVWTVTEREIRSTAGTAVERRAEEREYLEAVRADDHPVARALWRIGARRVFSTVVRRDRPYTAVTEGSFDGVDEALGGLFDGLGALRRIELVRSPDGTTRLDLEIATSDDAIDEVPPDDLVLSLADDLERYRLVLTRGVFVEAEGFTLEREATVARMVDAHPADGVARYRLAWKDDPS